MNERVLKFLQPAVHQAQSLALRLLKGTTLGVRVAVTDGSRILLVRHSYVPGWYLPGGAVDPGETAAEAAVRELDEEAGIAPAGTLRLHGVFFNRRLAKRDHVLVYHVEAWRELRSFVPGREIVEAGFFPVDALPEASTNATRLRVAEICGGAPVSAEWG
ncbi:NUDIX domain-containing protein [Oryzibacter oryziterrae]|uniref:NUDIX domain-containing protein n=1 Tax=Oryzibacter oryziterrae TaxID=2766474 RepID=UPI001F1E0005|nr:NUDIX domain-containing protein [Oryzibacter oryziterrae]